jgi:hypothetical protein
MNLPPRGPGWACAVEETMVARPNSAKVKQESRKKFIAITSKFAGKNPPPRSRLIATTCQFKILA